MNTESITIEPVLRFAPKMGAYFLTMRGPENAHIAKAAGLKFHNKVKHWGTSDFEKALRLIHYADQTTRDRIERTKNLIALSYSNGEGFDYSSLKAVGARDYKPYQLAGILAAMQRPVTLLADEQGLGKTIQAIGVFNEMKAAGCTKPALIVCPASVKLNWRREFQRWAGDHLNIQILQGGRAYVDESADVIIVNYDLVAKLREQLVRPWGLVVCDEAHYLKNFKAQRTKAMLGYKLDVGIVKDSERILMLTGTPITNRPIEFWPMLARLAPETIMPFTKYFDFGRYFCDAYQGPFGWVMTGSKNERELNNRLRSTIMVRRLKKDVLKDLPNKIYQLIPLEASAEARKIIRKEGTLELSDAKKKTLKGFDAGQIAELRHQMAIAKLPVCITHIADLVDSGTKKVVVFAHHTAVLDGLREGLKDYHPVLIDGRVPSHHRQQIVDTFQTNDECAIFLGQMQAAGVGITLTAASTVVFVETSWVPGDIAQAVDRCHRIGQKDSVLAQFLVVQGSLEEYMLRTIVDKQLSISQILGDDT